MATEKILSDIHSPEDLKNMSLDQLNDLAGEIRETIIHTVSENGGHLASNLGAVDFTIALHHVFRSPEDKIIWDVGHQCYTHKLLTGRNKSFKTLRKKDGLSGFPKKSESPHDIMETGHASTSLSAGLGISVGQSISGTTGDVICVIGDGALTGGMALEALNYAAHLKKRLIIILNDNKMSINPNIGGLSAYLSQITTSRPFEKVDASVNKVVGFIPFIGKRLQGLLFRIKRGIKGVFFKETLFSDFGLDYLGPLDGHNIQKMTKAFRSVKDTEKPIVIHLITRKGKGYAHAEGNPSSYHGVAPFSVEKGTSSSSSNGLTMTQAFSDTLMQLAEEDEKIVAITAAMKEGTGLAPFFEKYPDRSFDVGIAEQHAVTFAAGLATSGLKPVVSIYSTFMQRSVDQVIHDIALQKLPVIIVMDRAGLVPADGETHQGIFDIALFRNIPDVDLLAPVNLEEMENSLRFALDSSKPTLIRYPKDVCFKKHKSLSQPFVSGRGVFYHKEEEANASKVLMVTVGGLIGEAEKCRKILKQQKNINMDIYNLRFASPLDENHFSEILTSYRYLFILEEGIKQGGIGERLELLSYKQNPHRIVNHYGVPKAFLSQASRKDLIKMCSLDSKSVCEAIIEEIESHRFQQVVEQVKNDKWESSAL